MAASAEARIAVQQRHHHLRASKERVLLMDSWPIAIGSAVVATAIIFYGFLFAA